MTIDATAPQSAPPTGQAVTERAATEPAETAQAAEEQTTIGQVAEQEAAAEAAPPAAKAPAKRPVRRAVAPKPVTPEPVVVEVVDAQVVEVEIAAVEIDAAEIAAVEIDADEQAAPATSVVDTKPKAETIENVTVVENDEARETVLKIRGLVKRFDDKTAVAGIDLDIMAGSFFGIVGPNGAGKTTTLSMVTGLLKPDAGSITVHGADVWTNPVVAKRTMGVLPDRLRLFDRLTGAQLLYYSGILHGLEKSVVRSRSADLSAAFGLEDALDRLVTDYSAGMTKKIAIAAAMIHSPRLLVLDEPFESVDPVSAANVIEILQKYVAAGGTVVMSSHTMNLIERICDSVAVVVNGAVLATGTMAEVRGDKSLEDRFVELAGGRKAAEGMEWLHKFSD